MRNSPTEGTLGLDRYGWASRRVAGRPERVPNPMVGLAAGRGGRARPLLVGVAVGRRGRPRPIRLLQQHVGAEIGGLR